MSGPNPWNLPSRRWLRFSLRSFLLFVVLISVSLGWVGHNLAHRRAVRGLAQEIREKGGALWSNYPARVTHTNRIYNWLEAALGEPHDRLAFDFLEIGPKVPTQEAGRLVRRATQTWKELRTLRVLNSELTAEDLAHVGNCSALTGIDLEGTPISDAALPHLARARGLKYVLLPHTDVSDQGLEHLASLPDLVEVDLRGTSVTAEGVARFRAARPGVVVYSGSAQGPYRD